MSKKWKLKSQTWGSQSWNPRAMCPAKCMGEKGSRVMEKMEPHQLYLTHKSERASFLLLCRLSTTWRLVSWKCGMIWVGNKELTCSKHLSFPHFLTPAAYLPEKQDNTATDGHTPDNDSHQVCSSQQVLIRRKAEENERGRETKKKMSLMWQGWGKEQNNPPSPSYSRRRKFLNFCWGYWRIWE